MWTVKFLDWELMEPWDMRWTLSCHLKHCKIIVLPRIVIDPQTNEVDLDLDLIFCIRDLSGNNMHDSIPYQLPPNLTTL